MPVTRASDPCQRRQRHLLSVPAVCDDDIREVPQPPTLQGSTWSRVHRRMCMGHAHFTLATLTLEASDTPPFHPWAAPLQGWCCLREAE
jgi:hypothetical protein